jgi:Zn-dependent protease
MRQGGIRLGRILGIPVSADLGVLLIGGLLTWLLAASVLPDGAPGLASSAYWSIAVVGAVLFLASLLAHEMSHSVVARRNGVEVEGVTLWMFGGVAQLRNEAATPGAEFRIAAAGPAMSVLIGVAGIGAAIGLRAAGLPELYVVMLFWLGAINVFLAVFNMLPGAPLDGGRVLGSALWRLWGDRNRAKVAAARVGRFFGLALVGLGVAELMFIGSFGGLWTAFIGWFLMNSARMEQAHYVGQQALGELPVSAAMVAHPQSVHVWTTVAEVVEGPLRSTAQSAVPVLAFDGTVAGVLTMDQVRRIPAPTWSTLQAGRVMVGAADLVTTTPDEPLARAIERLEPRSAGVLVVLDDGRLVGLVGPQEVQRAV